LAIPGTSLTVTTTGTGSGTITFVYAGFPEEHSYMNDTYVVSYTISGGGNTLTLSGDYALSTIFNTNNGSAAEGAYAKITP
jgi:hypothetical protein